MRYDYSFSFRCPCCGSRIEAQGDHSSCGGTYYCFKCGHRGNFNADRNNGKVYRVKDIQCTVCGKKSSEIIEIW